MKTKMLAAAALLATSAYAGSQSDKTGYGADFDTAHCDRYLAGAWRMEMPRVYAADGQHLDLGGEWTTTFNADGRFVASDPIDKSDKNGAWSVEPGSAAGLCSITMNFDNAKAPAGPSEWFIVDEHTMRMTSPLDDLVAYRLKAD